SRTCSSYSVINSLGYFAKLRRKVTNFHISNKTKPLIFCALHIRYMQSEGSTPPKRVPRSIFIAILKILNAFGKKA
ncbi:MAG: hypothetical protein MR299_00005, partial [Bacteroidales bacterium]|nr:hypothetical protein [Bacteroidales bacterium]